MKYIINKKDVSNIHLLIFKWFEEDLNFHARFAHKVFTERKYFSSIEK